MPGPGESVIILLILSPLVIALVVLLRGRKLPPG
jgi:hypothetical protein